jgi:hypothetical protein
VGLKMKPHWPERDQDLKPTPFPTKGTPFRGGGDND